MKRGWIAAGAAAGAPARLGPASAAVLPFANLSGARGDEYFSDGMSDTLLDRLSQVPQLRIAARTSSFSFKGKSASVEEIGAALGVAALVDGSVQRQGDTLRINAELIRVADGTHLWSKHYDRKSKDLFAIQDEIAAAVTQELVGRLLPSSKAALAKRGTSDLQAYQDYIQGHQAMNRLSLDSLQRAERLLQSAVARDPRYVAALLDLAQCWVGQYDVGAFAADELQRRATPILDRVEVIEPGNARVLALRGSLAQSRNDYDLARTLIERAVALAPDDYAIRIIADGLLESKGDRAGQLVHEDRMVALDPLNPFGLGQRALTLVSLDRLDEAEASARRALALDPDNPLGMAAMANAAIARHDLAGGTAWLLKIYRHNLDPSTAIILATNLDALNEQAAADAWMAEARRVQPENNFYADQYDIQRLFLRHQDAAAIAASKRFIEAHRQKWETGWNGAVQTGCAAAARSGKLEQMRELLVRDGFMPANFDPSTLLAWSGKGETGRGRLNRIYMYSPCSFDASPADAPRRAGLQAAYARLPASLPGDWKTTRDARLGNDRETLARVLARDETDSSWFFESLAVTYGVAGDPRVQAQLRVLLAREARARAELPVVLAREHLSMLPPPVSK
jgi:TolB-like protein/Tfp pilus assembly protein PilF